MNNYFVKALRIRSFFFLFLAEVFSQIGMNMMNFMVLLSVFSLTSSNTAVSGIVLAFTTPAILFAVIAGAYVDRWDKKRVLFLTNSIRALLLLLLALFHSNLFVLYIVTFLVSVVTQFFIPAETPMIPVIVEKSLLLSANALFGIALFGSIFVAYALAGPLLLLLGVKNGFFVLAGCFLLSSFFISLIHLPEKATPTAKKNVTSILQEVKGTLRLIIKFPKVFHAFSLLIISQTLILLIAAIGPGYAKNILHIPVNEFPLLFVTPAIIGLGIGTLLISRISLSWSKQKIGATGLLISAIALFLMPYGAIVASQQFTQVINAYVPHILQITILHIMIVVALMLGFANALIFVPSNTILQEETTEEIRGKTYGALNSLTSLIALIPILVIGPVADVFGTSSVLIILGIIVGSLAVVRFFMKI
ncbi:MAG TPA: MFS transporter [Patescibacteria group bacterium]|nr:MFS transporter [Patescibacteria group bacterium]